MRDLKHLSDHFQRYGRSHQAIYILSLMFLFWSMFDGITTYVTPLIVTQTGLSKTWMGVIVGSSSMFGAVFDFAMCKLFKRSYWRQVFLIMFALCLAYVWVLFKAGTVWFFLLAMALWGVYFDLKNFGSFDFVVRFTKKDEHSSSFGVLGVFSSLGYLLAPLIAGFLISDIVDFKIFLIAAIFLGISFLFFLSLIFKEKTMPQEISGKTYQYKGFFQELKLWSKLDKILLPVLIMTMVLNTIDAFFWTIGPLIAESFTSLHQFAGLFMTAYSLPSLLVGWWVGKVTRRLGKKQTAYLALFVGSLCFTLIALIKNPLLLIFDVFLASFLLSFAFPAIRAAFADYIKETEQYEKEIEGLEDFYTNIGYVIGPIIAGSLADLVGNAQTFTILGLFGVVMAIILFKISPKKINVLQSLN